MPPGPGDPSDECFHVFTVTSRTDRDLRSGQFNLHKNKGTDEETDSCFISPFPFSDMDALLLVFLEPRMAERGEESRDGEQRGPIGYKGPFRIPEQGNASKDDQLIPD